jgi:MFS family permease
MVATGGYALIAPLLIYINQDIGPSPNLTWIPISYLLCQSVVFLVVGGLSDIFGRRWFFVIGSIFGLVGSIVGATAQSLNALIGAEVLIGISAGFNISFFWVIGELVPMKWRYVANSYTYFMTIPTNPLAPKIAFALQTHTSVKWRGCFYFMIAINALSVVCWYFFYHPPTFKMLHRKQAAKNMLLHFDWIALVPPWSDLGRNLVPLEERPRHRRAGLWRSNLHHVHLVGNLSANRRQ